MPLLPGVHKKKSSGIVQLGKGALPTAPPTEPAPTGTIAGPGALLTGQQGTWTLSTSTAPSSVQWTVNGTSAGAGGSTLTQTFAGAGSYRIGAVVAFPSGSPLTVQGPLVAVTAVVVPAFQHGQEVTFANVGLAGLGIAESSLVRVTSLATTSANQVIEGRFIDGGILDIKHNGVVVRKSRIKGTGAIYAIRLAAGLTVPPRFEDCTISSTGASATVTFGTLHFARCALGNPGGNDIWKPRGPFSAVDSIFGGLQRIEGGHHDVLQLDTSLSENFELVRCNIDAYVPAAGETRVDGVWRTSAGAVALGGDPMNAAIQVGSTWAAGGGLRNGRITNCYFNGGNYTIHGNVDTATVQGLVTLRGNRFGRNFRYGALRSTAVIGWDIDASNVYADTRTPV